MESHVNAQTHFRRGNDARRTHRLHFAGLSGAGRARAVAVDANPTTDPTGHRRSGQQRFAQGQVDAGAGRPRFRGQRSEAAGESQLPALRGSGAPVCGVECGRCTRVLFTPLHWCFPFTGCISYRGYFHERGARQFAASLAARGNDTLVAGVTAYSTLGHFADPVTNTMLRYGDNDMIATIFHELTHQLIYVPGDSQFSESFAMSVELEGLRRWLSARGRGNELEAILKRHR